MKPSFVLISDIHFNIHNLQLAKIALKSAIDMALGLKLPLVIAGDLLDTKAIIRGECANAVIELLEQSGVKTYILSGNHDLLNHNSSEHSLNFLRPYAHIIDTTTYISAINAWLIPYQSSNEQFLKEMLKAPNGSNFIIHQGTLGAALGDYVKDVSSVDPIIFNNCKVLSGHYHKFQQNHVVTYVGSPFTHTFGEANDGPKGYLVVNEDFSFDRVILPLRKHVILETTADKIFTKIDALNYYDLLWIKVTGTALELDNLNKKEVGMFHLGHENFKLDKDYAQVDKTSVLTVNLSNEQIIDNIIDNSSETSNHKEILKTLWRELIA